MYQFDAFSNLVWAPVLVIFFLICSLKICQYFKIGYKLSICLYIWHTIFCIFYIWFALNYDADSNKYFYNAINFDNRDFNFGTSFIVYLTYFLNKFFGFSYFDQFLIHGFIGYIGLLAFAGAIKQSILEKSKNIKILGYIILFIPSASFWTTALGKDAISFMATGLALWAALDFKNRKMLLFFSILSMFMVRPHMGVLLALAFLLALIFDKKTQIYVKLIFGSFALITTVAIIPIMLNYIGLGEAEDLSDVDQYVDKRQNSNLGGGSSLDISSMSLPMQMFTYLFRPLPFEAHTIFALLASLDNVILLFLFILGIYSYINKRRPSVESNRLFIWIYFFLALIILSMTTANLGIAMRQKWMFIPFLIFLLLSVIGKVKTDSPRKM